MGVDGEAVGDSVYEVDYFVVFSVVGEGCLFVVDEDYCRWVGGGGYVEFELGGPEEVGVFSAWGWWFSELVDFHNGVRAVRILIALLRDARNLWTR